MGLAPVCALSDCAHRLAARFIMSLSNHHVSRLSIRSNAFVELWGQQEGGGERKGARSGEKRGGEMRGEERVVQETKIATYYPWSWS